MTTIMAKHCRTIMIYYELHKAIKNSLISHIIYLDLCSENAMNCAYNGIEHTIRSIVKDIGNSQEIRIDDYSKHDSHKTFSITRSNNVYVTNINLRVEKIDDKNQIMFQFHIYM
jgi:hypothetical protein